ncbi:MAG: SDR family oxidoreductase [Planctomycetales bacterium]
MRDLDGRTAIVTGASGGLGAPIARALVEVGMNVVLVARSADKLERLADELNAGVQPSGCSLESSLQAAERAGDASSSARQAEAWTPAIAFPADITDQRAAERLVAFCLEKHGAIDLLVNNAGIETYYPFHLLDPAAIRASFELNVTAAAVLTRLVLPHMLARRRGHIVNISSTAGKHGPACGAAYGASKAALIAFTQALRMEYRSSGVSASVICPGFVRGDGMYARMCADAGRKVPSIVGTASAKGVTRALLKAVRRDLPEVVVNRPPLRPLFALTAAFPQIGEWIAARCVRRFLTRVAAARAQRDSVEGEPENRRSAA